MKRYVMVPYDQYIKRHKESLMDNTSSNIIQSKDIEDNITQINEPKEREDKNVKRNDSPDVDTANIAQAEIAPLHDKQDPDDRYSKHQMSDENKTMSGGTELANIKDT